MKILDKIKKHVTRTTYIGIAVGAIAGYAYYYFIGCNSGSCPITSSPTTSVIYGAVMGLVATIK